MGENTGKFLGWLQKYASADLIIVGAGPAGLMAALDLARLDLKALVIERKTQAGGRLWASDFLISASSTTPQFMEIMDELKVPYKKGKSGLSVNAGVNIPAKLISCASDAGVRILNMAEFKDLICSDGKIDGIEINWNPQLALEDKVCASISASFKSQVVIDASGVEACVYHSLFKRKALDIMKYKQIEPLIAEGLLLEKTGMIYPGLAVAGLSVATIYGIPREGLTLASLLLSGRKIAQEVEMFFAENYIGLEKKRR